MKKARNIKLHTACLTAAVAIAAASVAPFGAGVSANLNANANSGPSSWHGVTASGTVFTGENCPIEVESELLTFDIPQFINHGTAKAELLEYGGKFAAQYTFKNPTGNEVNAELAFPLGSYSDYGYWEDGGNNYVQLEDLLADKYTVAVDGVQIAAEARTTFHERNGFDFSSESKRLYDGYRPHEFFTPDLPVYKYTFKFASEEEDYFEAKATVQGTGGLRLAGSYGSLENVKGGGTAITYSATDGRERELYSIGGELDTAAISWKFYKMTGYLNMIEKSVKASVELVSKEDGITFENYVFKAYSGVNDASKTELNDFYNAVLDYIDEYMTGSLLPSNYGFLQKSDYIMRWLVYDLHFAAGQTVENTVSAPLFPGGYYYYTPYVYTYYYLLSPARQWSDFKKLEIRINTPYYLTGSNLTFQKTDYGYVYLADGLPDEDLSLEMCTVENPERKVNSGYAVLVVFFVIIGVFVFIVPLAALIIFFVWVGKRSKKRNTEADRSGHNGFKPMNMFDGGNSADGDNGGRNGN